MTLKAQATKIKTVKWTESKLKTSSHQKTQQSIMKKKPNGSNICKSYT